ncbi:MAG TPA: M17 family peptidase N-terminal domain-containing protein [Tepidisphaeraceae bacterium]|jgi:hypothetical protein|nr:M17 family peptidase N-terminal domain-containing protein [Tepidisphaeraceae bacterium]
MTQSKFTLHRTHSIVAALISACLISTASAATKQTIDAPHDQTISVEMIGPAAQTTDLQMLCILKHDPAGDKYIEAMDDLNQKLHHLLSNLRDRGEFPGDFGQTLSFTPPPNSITPKQILLIGVGDEKDLTLDKLQTVGSIAARESLRLKAATVSFAPTLRDQGSTRIDVPDGDASITTGWILAYDTEMKLQSQHLSPLAKIPSLTIEAGPKYFPSTLIKVTTAIKAATTTLQQRPTTPYTDK